MFSNIKNVLLCGGKFYLIVDILYYILYFNDNSLYMLKNINYNV